MMNSIYVHIPFCVKKCSYCDFNSFSGIENLMPAYFDALEREIEIFAASREKEGFKAGTIFIGGGTPSLPDSKYIVRVMEKLRGYFDLDPLCETTIESNPCSLTASALRDYRSCGINRLSIGLQAAQDDLLKTLGRSHDGKKFFEAYKSAREAGFDNINVDVIFGIPGQTDEMWAETLDTLIGLAPEHISAYSLTLDDGVPMAQAIEQGILEAPGDEADRKMYHRAVTALKAAGYVHYEISNFALPGRECRHNLNYWQPGEYIGFGAGAHSYLDGRRWNNVEDPAAYIERAGGAALEENIQTLSMADRIAEFFILRLRLTAGIDLAEFEAWFGAGALQNFSDKIDRLISRGILTRARNRLMLTDYGLDVANQAMLEFI